MNLLVVNATCVSSGVFQVDLKTFIVVTLFRLAEPCSLRLKVLGSLSGTDQRLLKITLDDLDVEILENSPALGNLCSWPAILMDKYVISGLCSVARQICKASSKDEVRRLLGFREACLVSCAETSVWTRFCEIDIIQTVNQLLIGSFIGTEGVFRLPENVLRYENHLSQPVRVHNIYKLARDTQKNKSLTSSTPRDQLSVNHYYAEGPFKSLADFILFPCFKILFFYLQDSLNVNIEGYIPLIVAWFNRIKKEASQEGYSCGLDISAKVIASQLKVVAPKVTNVSLYKADPANEPSSKHTQQYKIESAMILVEKIKNHIKNDILPVGFQQPFTWEVIPLLANPRGGALPASRAARKCEQLENVVKAVIEVVEDRKYSIVDFCSGSGHLGILIAIVLPNCNIILVENKEQSLARALKTIEQLALSNITVVQSNLDYFTGNFDLGVALHACGVATDLVMQMCIKRKADFVCCPCCYGGVKNCHEVTYPRSRTFQGVFEGQQGQYFNLAHAADQTHEADNAKTQQGYFCMDVVDSDRKCYAEDHGYKVHLGKLQPASCTNKNNLLVGIYSEGGR